MRDAAPGTPLHAMLTKAHTKTASRVHVGRNGQGANMRYWDRHMVGTVLENGDLIRVGAREMIRALALTPPVAFTDPGERLLYSLRASLDGDMAVMVQAIIATDTGAVTTWWHVGYDHALERLVAERCDSPTRPRTVHRP